MNVPYVVSGDIRTLLGRWAKEKGFTLPSDRYFEELRNRFSGEMRQIFSAFELISEEEIGPSLQALSERRSLPIVTMECAYVATSHHLELARMADSVGNDKGLGSRNGIPPHVQAQALANQGLTDVVLAEDHRYAVHYVIPWENASSWASIPTEQALLLADFCINRTSELFAEISKVSGKEVLCKDLTRSFIGAWREGENVAQGLAEVMDDYFGPMCH